MIDNRAGHRLLVGLANSLFPLRLVREMIISSPYSE